MATRIAISPPEGPVKGSLAKREVQTQEVRKNVNLRHCTCARARVVERTLRAESLTLSLRGRNVPARSLF